MRYLLLKVLQKKEKGFTLIEIIVTVIMIGILSAASTPGIVGSWRQSKVKESLTQLKSTLEQAQANANRMSRNCTVTINGVANGTSPVTIDGVDYYQVVGAPNGCVLETINIRQDFLTITTNATTATTKGIVTFNFRGQNTNNLGAGVDRSLVIYRNGSSATGKCLVISELLGMMRVAEYEGDASGTIDPDNCKNTENSKYIKN